MKYDVWLTKDGREIKVVDMTDRHLLNTIRAIKEARIFPEPVFVYSNGDERDIMTVSEVMAGLNSQDRRENWLTVLQGEALKRGLDWSKPPTRKIPVFELFHSTMSSHIPWPPAMTKNFEAVCRDCGFEPPMVDVCNETNRVTYLHWQTGQGVGTPIHGT